MKTLIFKVINNLRKLISGTSYNPTLCKIEGKLYKLELAIERKIRLTK